MIFDTVTIITGLTGLFLFGIGLVVFLANKNSPTNRRFIAFVVATSLWLITNYVSANPNEPHDVLLWANKLVLIFGGLPIILLLDFIIHLASFEKKYRWSMAIVYAINSVSWVLCLTPVVVRNVYVEAEHVVNVFGGLEMVYFLPLFATTLALCAMLIVLRLKTVGIIKSQIKSLSNSIIFAVVVIVVGNALLPVVLNNYALINYTPLSASAIVITMIYAMINHQLFDIKQATMRTVGYALTVATMAGIYVALAYAISLLFFRGRIVDGVSFSPLNIGLALILAFIFQPIKRFFDRITNRIFYHNEYDRDTFFREFGQILAYDTDLRLLLRQASSYIATNLKAETAFFYIADCGIFGQNGSSKIKMSSAEITQIARYYQAHHRSPEAIVASGLKQPGLEPFFAKYHVQIILPLRLQEQVIGYLFIGEHKSRGYSARDIKILESIVNELAIAVQNSLSVEEIRELNTTLQQRINQATAELRTKNRQLQRLDEVKDEFMSIASHQLRTPLTSIKGYVDMMLEGDFGPVPAKQREVLGDVFSSSERMVQLINDFLNVSRIQTGKFALERRPTDLAELIETEIQLMSAALEQRNLKIGWSCDDNLPLLNIDADKVRQVVVNMIDNAMYYSQADATIKIELVKAADDLVFTVIDNGIGVPAKEQASLFSKFFRASNARKRRPDGTGVGLYLAKKIIDTHGGEIIFKSAEGKGSTFGFKLPIVA